MEKKLLLQKYGRHYDIIQKLGSYPVLYEPTVKELVENRSELQGAYREIRSEGLKLRLTEYFASLSLAYLLDELRRDMPPGASMLEWALAVVENYERYPVDVRNLLWLYAASRSFYRLFKAEIGIGEVTEKWGRTTRDFLELIECDALLTGMLELISAEDATEEKRADHARILGYLKERAKEQMNRLKEVE